MTRRRLKEAGFGDEQVQALVEVTGAERRALSADMAGLKASEERVKGEIAAVHTRIDGLRDEVNARFAGLRNDVNARFDRVEARFDGARDEMNARFDRVDARFDGVRDEMNAKFDGVRDDMNARFAGVDRQLKVVMWFLGAGLTLYTGTTVSLVLLLFRDAAV